MRPTLQVKFYETYYFANVVRNILHDQFSYLRNLNEFYGDGSHLNYVAPFKRYSAFHSFIEFLIDSLLYESNEDVDLDKRRLRLEQFKEIPSAIEDIKPTTLPIEHAFAFHGIAFPSFVNWLSENSKSFESADSEDIQEYMSDLRSDGCWDKLVVQSVRESFYLLFANRKLLQIFNEMMAQVVSDTMLSDLDVEMVKFFRKDGVLKRHNIPTWVQRAVYFRDRGICVHCQRDLTGLSNIWSQDNFDHMVPLRAGGLNDVSNIQLLCADCNLAKKDKMKDTSESYEDWYPMEQLDSFGT